MVYCKNCGMLLTIFRKVNKNMIMEIICLLVGGVVGWLYRGEKEQEWKRQTYKEGGN